MLQTSFPRLKKHHPTRLYMLYPIMQSVLLVCVEIDKQMPPQGGIVHCHWKSISTLSIIRNHFGIQILNFEVLFLKIESISYLNFELCHTLLHTSAWTTVGAANTPQRANQKPYRHGTDAPRLYPHTLIAIVEGHGVTGKVCTKGIHIGLFRQTVSFGLFRQTSEAVLKRAACPQLRSDDVAEVNRQMKSHISSLAVRYKGMDLHLLL